MKAIKIISLAVLGLTFTPMALAGCGCMPLPCGWYIEGNVGSSKTSNLSFGSGSSFNSTGFGWNANIGYKFMPFFAAEAGYTQYATLKIKIPSGTQAGQDKQYAIDLAGKGILPIGETGAELFAKIGAARVSSKITVNNALAASSIGLIATNHTATGYYVGFGAAYSVMPALPINIQWTRAKGDSTTGTNDLYSIGAAYIFG